MSAAKHFYHGARGHRLQRVRPSGGINLDFVKVMTHQPIHIDPPLIQGVKYIKFDIVNSADAMTLDLELVAFPKLVFGRGSR